MASRKYQMMGTIAIIGAAVGQLPLYLKAHEMGLRIVAFAWEHGAVCRDYADVFYPISIFETGQIVEACRKENVVGVVSNCSDLTAYSVAEVAQQLCLPGIAVEAFKILQDKNQVRALLSGTEGLSEIWHYQYDGMLPFSYPCVVKPSSGSGKKGVCFVGDKNAFAQAIDYATAQNEGNAIVEEYIEGREISVETISSKGRHYIVQITDKDTSGAPHFIEIGHHQPSLLPSEIKCRIADVIPQLLTRVNISDGAAHVEMKVTLDGGLYLIEINPRGGGDEISNTLVELSTDFDYLEAMINVALGKEIAPEIRNVASCGIYYLCRQTEDRLDFFCNADAKEWLIKKKVSTYHLSEGTTNYDRNGYLIYKSDHKILPNE